MLIFRPFLMRRALQPVQACQFSDFFRSLDKKSYDTVHSEKDGVNKLYKKRQDRWKIPLEKKKLRRAAKLERDALREPIKEESELLVAHGEDIEYPPADYGMFAVI